jgi:hypothetical protein
METAMMTGEERMAQRRQMVACIPEQEIAAYRAARDAFVAASERADKAESPIWRMDVDPAWVDEMDGVDAGRD